MPHFVYPSLLAGLALLVLPVLIHLIHMLRHRRVQWAAMEFLLVSQKKNRTWILFKQLLLLLARLAIIALIVLMLARPMLSDDWARWFGRMRTHHVLLLDDSFSMSDRWADTSAWAEARSVMQRIAEEASRQVQPQSFTLLRFSLAGRTTAGTHPDLLQESLDSQFLSRFRAMLDKLTPSQTAAEPGPALESIASLLGESDDEQRIVYLISDFRARQWSDPRELRQRLGELEGPNTALMLVHCAAAQHANLAITSLEPRGGTRAVGVPFFMEVAVENFGPAPVRDVAVLLQEDGHARPAVRIEQIEPGKIGRERFPVQFATAGQHVVIAKLEGDAVAADNRRWCVMDVPLELPVLLVDGDPAALDARYLGAALAPGGAVRTGLSPRVATTRFLSTHPLDEYRAIYLLNVDLLEKAAITALEEYVKAGGGLALFLGERTSAKFFNDELYRDGKGLFPLPLAGPAQLLVDRLQPAPDLEVTDHPMFRILAGQRNSFISTVTIERYMAAPKDWTPPVESTVQVIARLRNGAPLAVERRFGSGRVVAVLTSAAPTWNNWARSNPSFLVAVQELQAYLGERPLVERIVGEPLRVELDPAKYSPQVRFLTPHNTTGIAADAAPGAGGMLTTALAETDAAGLYEIQLLQSGGNKELRFDAYNVDPQEGDLRPMSGAGLAQGLQGIRYQYELASQFEVEGRDRAGVDLSENLLYLLAVLLLAEQLLARSASYHPGAFRLAGKGASR